MTENPDAVELPEVVRRYLRAHDAHDVPAALAAFTPQAVVADDGQTYEGTVAIARWLERAGSEYTYTTTLVGAESEGLDRYTVVQHLEGDFPGGTVDLRYRFALDGGLISRLDIAP
ncbi:nuclear transport factor 2 family protein [Streptomyces sp. NPDC005435]|uniref:nuclear transport factor 2 family protein n=1 Tax=Streptomyces sp. NPDC005435 TaxID=3154464 RepID=UPI003456F59D